MGRKEFVFRAESRVLDQAARSTAPGQFVELPGGIVHYDIAGPVDAQPVVLIHGFSVPSFIWDPTFVALAAAGFRVLRYDLFGRGYSDRPDATYNQDLFDQQLWNLLQVLGINQPVDLVGLSMGGALAVYFADRHPKPTRRVALVDPAGLDWEQPLALKFLQVPWLGEWLMSLLADKVILSRLRDYFQEEDGYHRFVQAYKDQMNYIGFKRALLSTLRSGVITGAEHSFQRLGQLGTPIILFWGRNDRVVPFALSEKVIKYIPNLEFYPVADAAHIPHYERPEIVNPLLVEFLSRPSG